MSKFFLTLSLVGVVFLFACFVGGMDRDYGTPGSQNALPDYITFWWVFGVAAASVVCAVIAATLDD